MQILLRFLFVQRISLRFEFTRTENSFLSVLRCSSNNMHIDIFSSSGSNKLLGEVRNYPPYLSSGALSAVSIQRGSLEATRLTPRLVNWNIEENIRNMLHKFRPCTSNLAIIQSAYLVFLLTSCGAWRIPIISLKRLICKELLLVYDI